MRFPIPSGNTDMVPFRCLYVIIWLRHSSLTLSVYDYWFRRHIVASNIIQIRKSFGYFNDRQVYINDLNKYRATYVHTRYGNLSTGMFQFKYENLLLCGNARI